MAAITVPVLAPEAARGLGVNPALIGLYVGCIYLGASTGALVSGGFILRYGSMRVSQACLAWSGMGLALLPFLPLWAIPFTAVMIGWGYGPITPASSQVLAKAAPPHLMARVFSIKQTGVPIGAMLAGALVPPLTVGFSWQVACWSIAAACIAVAFLAQPWRKAFDADRDAAHPISFNNVREPFKLIFADPRLKLLAVVPMVYASVQMCVMTYLVTWLREDLSWSLISAGLALSTANLAGVIGRIVWGAVADKLGSAKHGPMRVLIGLGFAMALFCVALAFFTQATPTVLILVVAALTGATAIGWNGVHLAEVARVAPPGRAGVVTGGTSFFTFAGVVLAPPLFGAAHGITQNYGWNFALVALFPLAMGVFLALRLKRA